MTERRAFVTDRKGARIPLTSSSFTPPYAARISRCPATSRAHFRAENCSPKLCLRLGKLIGASIIRVAERSCGPTTHVGRGAKTIS